MATKEQQAGDSAAAKPARNSSVPLEKQKGSPSGSLHALRQLFGLLNKRERIQLACLFPLLLINSALEVVGLGIIPILIAALMDPQTLDGVPFVGVWLVDWAGGRDPHSILLPGSAVIALVFLGKNTYAVLLQYVLLRYCKGRQVSLGTRLFAAYQNAPLEFLFERNSAEFIRNVNTDVTMVANNVILAFLQIVTKLVTVVGILATIVVADWKISLIVLASLGALVLLYAGILNRLSTKLGQESLDARRDLVRDLNQGIQSIKETRIMGLEPLHVARVKGGLLTTTRAQRWQMLMSSASTQVLELVAVFGLLVIVLVVAGVTQGDLAATAPLLSLFAIALIRLRSHASVVLSAWNTLAFRVPSVHTVAADIEHLEHLRHKLTCGSSQPFTFEHSIEVKNVSYTYPGSNEPAVKDVTFTIPKGSTIGFSGATGSGKTTLIDLILGILEPQSGSITIDGSKVCDIQSLRKYVGYVPQNIYLFDDSLRANIAAGVKKSKIDDRQVWRVLKKAQIADFVESKAEGLDMRIGENGVRLSGGQRQRFGIARALYHNPEILVMDEGTSALDQETEIDLMNAINQLDETMTILLIAHRISTLSEADATVKMKNGSATWG